MADEASVVQEVPKDSEAWEVMVEASMENSVVILEAMKLVEEKRKMSDLCQQSGLPAEGQKDQFPGGDQPVLPPHQGF